MCAPRHKPANILTLRKRKRLWIEVKRGSVDMMWKNSGEIPNLSPGCGCVSNQACGGCAFVYLHGSIRLTMAKIREIFWIPRLRQLVKIVIKVCRGCKKFHALAPMTDFYNFYHKLTQMPCSCTLSTSPRPRSKGPY